MNPVYVALIVIAVLWSAWSGQMHDTTQASLEWAKSAVNIAFGLLGGMALWLGLLRVLQDAGVLRSLSIKLAPLMQRLFPDVPADHPAMGAMILNIAANMLGLGNAATPFGLKAMQELNKLNNRPGVATNSMALFLAINTSGVAVFPTGMIVLRSTEGSLNAGGIVLPSILATLCSTLVAISVAKFLQNRSVFAFDRQTLVEDSGDGSSLADGIGGLDRAEEIAAQEPLKSDGLMRAFMWLCIGVFLIFMGRQINLGLTMREILSDWLLPFIMMSIILFGVSRRMKVYESVIKGAREGFDIFIMIVPFLVVILVAIGMLRASGALEAITAFIQPVTGLIGFPAEALPMALIRPLSGSGALGVVTETLATHGPDSFVGFLTSVMNGSTETTFYVLAVYYGSVQIRAIRHTLVACLCADATGVVAAFVWSLLFYA